jgi:SAM-dependent methyltransferase
MTASTADRLKRHLQDHLPAAFGAAQSAWRWLLAVPLPDRAWRMERRLRRVAAALRARHGSAVLSGPFVGMLYVPAAIGSVLSPKLIGCYEEELAPVMDRIIASDYRVVVDVGCAEGYYAIGLARRLPSAQVFAFDIDARARQLCADMGRINGVADRLQVGEFCDIPRLSALPLAGALLMCDCEGYEIELLQPELAPVLRRCDVLVELHDGRDPRITPTLCRRFAPTHEIQLIRSASRDPGAYPAVRFLRSADRRLAVCEFRSPQQWAFMTVKSAGSGREQRGHDGQASPRRTP